MVPSRMRTDAVIPVVRRLIADESGQDLIEYALLTALVVAGGIALLPSIQTGMSNAYSAWDAQSYTIWIPGPPTP